MASNYDILEHTDSCKSKDETDKDISGEEVDEQCSALNKSGKKCTDLRLLEQIKDNPLSKNKPDAPLLESRDEIRILANLKLAPPEGTTATQGQGPSNKSITKNMYSVLENAPVESNPTSAKVGGRGRILRRPNALQAALPKDLSEKVKLIIDLSIIMPDEEEFRQEIMQFEIKYHAAVVALILNITYKWHMNDFKTVKDVNTTLTKYLVHLVTTNTISMENFGAGLNESLCMAPHYINIPKFYDIIGILLAPLIEKKHLTLATTFNLCRTIVAANQGHLLLKAIIHNLKDSMGRTFVKAIWQESGLRLSQWMNEEQLRKVGGEGRRPATALAAQRRDWDYNQRRLFPEFSRSNPKNLANIKLAAPQRSVLKPQQGRAPGYKFVERGSVHLRRSPGVEANAPQEPLPENLSKKIKPIVDLSLINPDNEEFRQEIMQFETKYHAAVVALILNIMVEKSVKDVNTLTKSLVHLMTTNTISIKNFEAGLEETLYMAPDLFIDIPKFYDIIGIILEPHIEKKHITLAKTFDLCETIIAANQSHLLLKAIIHNLKDSMGRTFAKAIWQESGLRLSQWMNEELVLKWIADNMFEFLED